MILAESPRRMRVTRLVSWGHWFALANIVFALTISSIFLFSSPSPGSLLGNAYLVTNWLGHISFITFIGFVILILPLCYVVSNEKAVKATGSVVAAIGLALLAFDALLYTRTGFHISFSAAELVRDEAQYRISQFGWQQWSYLLLLFFIWLGCQLVLANAIWKRLERLNEYKIGLPVTSVFVFCFVSSHAVHVWADAQLYQPIIKQDNLFPLSYPATAKTTLSRYGLLDLARYEQRKQLQFNSNLQSIRYPSEPVYCSVNDSRPTIVFIQTDDFPLSDFSSLGLSAIEQYYATSSSRESLVMSAIFGVPELYKTPLLNKRPVLLALPHAQGMHVSISTDAIIEHNYIKPYQEPFAIPVSGMHIAFTDAQTIRTVVNEGLIQSHHVIIAGIGNNPQQKGVLYSNLTLKAELASIEDIAPTILHAFGCDAPPRLYSTGRNLLDPSRNWIVSTSEDKIVVVNNNQRIEVMSNGSYEIINTQDNSRSNEQLNVDLLSQAIKHLTRFSVAN
ncbi:DUF3413 domain-containing protein [Alteromonas sediminis]|uniref:DUF3413 domain-containing protein n=1 Tax=Alteromonas sediminis TaxID=2259342 RepID=A0A3N5Y171_9ALTE|nr:DUF3413 domain-containing protein [Alteromonas sediminis]RPJ67547.1 DUF3413 domain-containing protein [Alteromonas sediminis]